MIAVFLDSEGLHDLSLQPFKEQCSSFTSYPTTPPELVDERIAGANIVILNKVRIGRENFFKASGLQLICVVATGTDVVDLQAASEMGVSVCNCQAYGTDSVVQHVMSVMLAMHTNLLSYDKAVRDGRWQTAQQFCFIDHPIVELKGKTLGIVGYGTLGKGVAKIAKSFGMHVLICRRPGGPVDKRPTLNEMLPQVDVVTLHCPLTEQTKNLIGPIEFTLMKSTAFLINCARGGIVQESALVHALQAREIQGAAVDVLTLEPPDDSNPLLTTQLPNLLITPHIAWASTEARERIIEQTAENIKAFKAGTTVRQVNSV